MPLCADPNATGVFSLPTDRKIPKKDRPEFIVRFVTESEAMETGRQVAAAVELPDTESRAAVEAILRKNITGFRNMKVRGQPIEFKDLKSFSDILTPSEIWSLARSHLYGVMPDSDDELGLRSPQPSGTGESAPVADPAPA